MSPSSIVSISPSMAVRFCLMYWHGFMLGKLLLFSHPVMFNFLWPHGIQHTRPPCPSSSPKVCPSSCPLHQWCPPASLSSDIFFSFCPQSFPASGTFLMSHLFASGDQNTRASASASVLPMSIQGWLPLRLVWSPCCPRNSQESFPVPQFKGISSTVRRHQLLRAPFISLPCTPPHVSLHSASQENILQFFSSPFSLLGPKTWI